MKATIIFASATVFSMTLISCADNQSGSTATRRDQANVTVSQNAANSQNETGTASVQQSGNSTNVVINRDGEKNVIATSGNSTVEIGKSGINIKASGGSQTLEQSHPGSINGKTVVINNNRQTQTIDCNGGAVVVNGNKNNLTLRGVCTISVDGNDNIIAADATTLISTSGNNNKVSWSKGADGKEPVITDTGDGNTISQTK